jgi:hypothetical protein
MMDSEKSEMRNTFGRNFEDIMIEEMKKHRISVLWEVDITLLDGSHRLNEIRFKYNTKDQREYFLRPDVVIVESGKTKGQVDYKDVLHLSKPDEIPRYDDSEQAMIVDKRFSTQEGRISNPILAAGECAMIDSFISRARYRTQDVKYNIDAGFFAAMSMMDKAVNYYHFPMTRLSLPDKEMYYVGERGLVYDECKIDGDVKSGKYVIYFLKGDEILGVVTCGYQNLHLYMWEAFKLLIMPTATVIRMHELSYKDIVAGVLKHKHRISAGRHHVVNVPSVMSAVKEDEIEYVRDFKAKLRSNLKHEKAEAKEKFEKVRK